MKTTTITRAFAIILAAFALTACGGGVSAVEHTGFADTHFGDYCSSRIGNDTFDGKTASAICMDYADHMSVGARCKNNTTSLVIQTGKYMIMNGLHLRVALDGVETPLWIWDASASREALFIEPAIHMIREILKHSHFQVRIIEIDGDTHNAEFDISRFGEAIKPVRDLCGW